MSTVHSWGRLRGADHLVKRPAFLDQAQDELRREGDLPILCHGRGRSYGDVGLNENGRLLVTDSLDRLISFDKERGILRAEAGVTIDRLLGVVVPLGWFVPVTPGTKFVTLGGVVANDVHGKNHETDGCFGSHISRVGLALSSGDVLTLSPHENAALFEATIGGLGLTGMILWVEIQLAPIASAFIESETIPIRDLEHFFAVAEESQYWPYGVGWVDALATGGGIGRGCYIRGRHAENGELAVHRAPQLSVPFDVPASLLNQHSIQAFNSLYRYRSGKKRNQIQHYDAFFYPLDAIGSWNRLYGRRGFFQHQSVVPMTHAFDSLRKMLSFCSEAREGSFLVVLKLFGDRRSPGLLSFPRPGATLALDFPNRGESTRRLLTRMEDEVMKAGGRLYPAKDATMSPETFQAGYPDWVKLERLRDPAINSDFWRRVTGAT
jgi:L-gulonolactone oxidase